MGKRIQARLDELGWHQTKLLEHVPELSKSSLSAMILRDSSRSQWSERIADALGVNHRWLQTGEGPRDLIGGAVSPFRPPGFVPLLAWEALSAMNERAAWEQALTDGKPITTREVTPRPGWFALRIDSDAMTAPPGAALSLPRGTIVVVDPFKRAAPGDYVIARDPQTGAPTCKRLAADAGRLLLVPLNSAYPAVSIDSVESSIIGVCVEWQTGGVF
ncbi:MAG: hypothetical protein RL756_682 [Pseudomonadota bacterium]|jgi:SOS-response transcriptional repressor LexA